MGCGVSRFEKDQEADQFNPLPFDADHHDRNNHSQAKLIGRKSVFSRINKKKDQRKWEIKTTMEEEETQENNSKGDGESQSGDQDIDPGNKLEKREDGLKFPRSPSFNEYCNSENDGRSKGIIKSNGNVDEAKICMSQMEQSPDVDKKCVVQTVKKDSSVLRRITGAIARSRQARNRKYSILK